MARLRNVAASYPRAVLRVCRALLLPLVFSGVSLGCADEDDLRPVVLSTGRASLTISLDPFALRFENADGEVFLESAEGEGVYKGPAATVDEPYTLAKALPGWDTYSANEGPWVAASLPRVVSQTATSAAVELRGDGVTAMLVAEVNGDRIHLRFTVQGGAEGKVFNKISVPFALKENEHFFGMGERFATLNHRGQSLYTWAEEGALGGGEAAEIGPLNPYPNGPSMTYFPVPFFLSSEGYGVHLTTTYRTENHFGSEVTGAYRLVANAREISMTVYAGEPLNVLDAYTEDTGRPVVPAPWVFGPRRRVNVGAQVGGEDEAALMRKLHIPITGIDDAIHFLPALSQLGKEEVLKEWTKSLHAQGYKAMAYNNPYVAKDNENAAADYQHGVENGLFVKLPDGEPALTQFVSGKFLTLAAIDLSNPDGFLWFQSLLKRSLDIGYDGWMHDFGEYIPREAVLFDGRLGDEFHNAFPVLSAKAAHELMQKERPGDYLYFVRSGGSGTQAYTPAVWGGDAEASFDEAQGLPSAVRGGLNLSMSGVPYWGSDMTGFKCLTALPNDKEVFFRWVEFGAVSPIMMEQDACVNPVKDVQKWKLWNDDETIALYRKYALLHTRLSPYFDVLAKEAHQTGKPVTLHPFLTHPKDATAQTVDDAYFLGPALYVSPVVKRGLTAKETYLPAGRYVEWETFQVFDGGAFVTTEAPLEKLPMWLVFGEILPLLDSTIDTLGEEESVDVVSLNDVAGILDLRVALEVGQTATLELADGTSLSARRTGADGGNPLGLVEAGASADVETCEGCFFRSEEGDVKRLRVGLAEGAEQSVTFGDVELKMTGTAPRKTRWDVLLAK